MFIYTTLVDLYFQIYYSTISKKVIIGLSLILKYRLRFYVNVIVILFIFLYVSTTYRRIQNIDPLLFVYCLHVPITPSLHCVYHAITTTWCCKLYTLSGAMTKSDFYCRLFCCPLTVYQISKSLVVLYL